MIRRLALILPTLALVAFIIFVMTRPEQRPPSESIGRAVPVFNLPGFNALHPGLSDGDLRRGTVTIVNLFASWCLPCKVEAPHLKALQTRGLVVHGIAVSDKPADTEAFLQAYGDPYARIGVDSSGAVSKAFKVGGIPETFVVDGKGTIVFHHVGDIRSETVPLITAAVDKARRR